MIELIEKIVRSRQRVTPRKCETKKLIVSFLKANREQYIRLVLHFIQHTHAHARTQIRGLIFIAIFGFIFSIV